MDYKCVMERVVQVLGPRESGYNVCDFTANNQKVGIVVTTVEDDNTNELYFLIPSAPSD